jgi:hypothetical protein
MQAMLNSQALEILAQGQDLTLATTNADGWPYASTVSYVSDGLSIYFGCDSQSLKAQNLLRDSRASLTIGLPYVSWKEIRGLSMAVRARPIEDAQEIVAVSRLFLQKFPHIVEYVAPTVGGLRLFALTPVIVQVLDYRQGFGHVDRFEPGGVPLETDIALAVRPK